MRFSTPDELLSRRVEIVVAGAGGTGSQLLDGLASLCVTLERLGHPGFGVTVFDPDCVSEANLGRQRFTPADVGLNKAEILVHRVNLFYGLRWNALPEPLSAGRRTQLLITCTDSAALRREIGMTWGNGLWLDTGNTAAGGQVVLGHLGNRGSGLRLPNVVDLYSELLDEDSVAALDADGPSCSLEEAISRQQLPINRLVADVAQGLIWNLFRHGGLDHHGAFVSCDPPSVQPLAVDPLAWQAFGYQPEAMTSPAA